MKVLETAYSKSILKTSNLNSGCISFFNDFAIIEFAEGSHIDKEYASEIFNELTTFYGKSKPFGLISNRVNSYSIKLLDFAKIKQKIGNLHAYGVVGYNAASKMNAELENSFCVTNNIHYKNLDEAITTIQLRLKNETLNYSTK